MSSNNVDNWPLFGLSYNFCLFRRIASIVASRVYQNDRNEPKTIPHRHPYQINPILVTISNQTLHLRSSDSKKNLTKSWRHFRKYFGVTNFDSDLFTTFEHSEGSELIFHCYKLKKYFWQSFKAKTINEFNVITSSFIIWVRRTTRTTSEMKLTQFLCKLNIMCTWLNEFSSEIELLIVWSARKSRKGKKIKQDCALRNFDGTFSCSRKSHINYAFSPGLNRTSFQRIDFTYCYGFPDNWKNLNLTFSRLFIIFSHFLFMQ